MPRKKITPPELTVPSGESISLSAGMDRPAKTNGGLAPSMIRSSPKRSKTKAAKTAREAAPTESTSQKLLNSAVSESEQIALLAYSYWEERGRQGGSAEDDWLRAEREFRTRRDRASKEN